MKRRRSLGIAAGCLVGIIVFCTLQWSGNRATDELKYRRSVRSLRAATARQADIRRLPRFLSAPVRWIMVDRPGEAYRLQEQRFLTSGFLTNAVITWTHASATFTNGKMATPSIDDVKNLFLAVAQEDDFLITKMTRDYRTRRVTIELTCPSQFVPLFEEVVENSQGHALAPNPQGGANGKQPFSSGTNRQPTAAASRR